ncbi:MAG: hypothetical protein R3E89_04290 [Thiolinea sp.]
MSQTPLLDVVNLHTYLNSGGEIVKAVDGISFSIPSGRDLLSGR